MLDRQLERLARAGFQLLPTFEIVSHYVVERDGFAALVEKRPDGSFGQAGSPGLLSGGDFAVLVWKESDPVFVARGREEKATEEQVRELRRFDADLAEVLR